MLVWIRDIMIQNVVAVPSDCSVGRAACIMEAQKIGCLPVLEEGRLIGIITSRDVRVHHANRLVADAMSRPVVTVDSYVTIWDAEEIMKEHNIEHLPVVEKDRLVGLLTKGILLPLLSLHCDHLTKLPRASYGCYLLSKWMAEGKPVSSIFVDLDNFGEINKSFGHTFGDLVLCKAAYLITSQVHQPATTCRYGGDEFLVVTPCHFAEAYEQASRILATLEQNTEFHGIRLEGTAGIASSESEEQIGLEKAVNIAENLISRSSIAAMQAKTNSTKIAKAS